MNDRSKIFIGLLLLSLSIVVIITVVVVVWETQDSGGNSNPTPVSLESLISLDRLMLHLYAFQNISDTYNGSRTAITGYNASVAYVVDQLKENTNFEVELQYFNFPFFEVVENPTLVQTAPNKISYQYLVDFQNLRYGGSGNVTAAVQYVGGACQASNFSLFHNGSIALISRGYLLDCNMTTKLENALAHNASAILVFYDPETNNGLFSAGLVPGLAPIPALALTYTMGILLSELAIAGSLRISLSTSNRAPIVPTANVLAQTPFGDSQSVLVLGSHLDSVLAGPGLNDNGSGSSANLELAIQLARSGLQTRNRIRFAWWAAEELGLLGSQFYVNNLIVSNPDELSNIALNLNFDMLASPNFFTGIYNGSSADPDIRNVSVSIQNLFVSYFDALSLPYAFTPFDGRSDYGPFISNGIPAGGLFSGAEKMKSPQQRILYGGLANTAFDPCYHQACDTIENIDQNSLYRMTCSAANVLQQLAMNPII